MKHRLSTARSRDLGMDLATIRREAGFNGQGLANALGWDQSKISRVEKGRQSIDYVDLISWLTACKIKGARLRRIVEHNREATRDTWLHPFNAETTPQRTFSTEESRARKLIIHAFGLVPGLLQTEPYIRSLMPTASDEQVQLRMVRLDLLRGENAPTAVFFIDEQALRRPVGGRAAHHDQLMHLMFLAEWTKITIRVVLTDIGAHQGVDGSFVLLDNRLVYLETKVANVFLENPSHVKSYEAAVKDLDRLALSETESKSFLGRLADEFGEPRGDHYDSGDVAQEHLQRY